jgi:glycerol uptake operon antiterminator
MRRNDFIRFMQDHRVVGAIKDIEGLNRILTSNCHIVFVLFGDIINIPHIVSKIKEAGKIVFVHVDLIDGLASKSVAVDFIAKNTCADGIISTRPNIVKRAKNFDLLTVQRFFVLDSLSLDNITSQIAADAADAIEILPGVMPKIIKKLVPVVGKPIIAGGLIADKDDVIYALDAGAMAISTTNENIWKLA